MRFLLLPLLLLVATLPAARAQDRPDREFAECTDCPAMVAIPAGRFLMGSPGTEAGRFDSEGPQHWVSVRAFALGKYPVSNDQFLVFLRATGYQPPACNPTLDLAWKSPGRGLAFPPGHTDPPTWPAVCLSWDDAEHYIEWLNAKVRGTPAAPAGHAGPYRLPSEAEWEYAARAGSTTSRWWGEAVGAGRANCNGCGSTWDNSLLAPVGSFGPNPFGLYDMLGNVWQWVDDCWHDTYIGAPEDGSSWATGHCDRRVMRGGSWDNLPVFVRSAARSRGYADGADFDYSSYAGFRLARTLP